MLAYIKRIVVTGSLLGAVSIFVPLALPVAAFSVSGTGLDNTANAATLDTGQTVPKMIGLVIRGALGIIGAIFLILIVYGGFLWMISEGDQTKVSTARGYIFHSILGLIITLSAYAITELVINMFISGPNSPLK